MDADRLNISVDRFLWLQAFVFHLARLGVPASRERLCELGEDIYEASKRLDPDVVAHFVWTNGLRPLNDKVEPAPGPRRRGAYVPL